MVRSRANIANRKKHILLKISLTLLVLILLLSSATYTWFAISKTPQVNDMAIYINSNMGMDISWDYKDEDGWGQHLDYSKKFPEKTVLKPVTYSYEDKCFFATRFGVDGRVSDIGQLLSDDRHTNRSDMYGYYVKVTFYVKSTDDVTVSLLDADRHTGTYVAGTPVWNGENLLHTDGGGGAQYAVRIGFRITDLDMFRNPVESSERFVIYEPNCVNYESPDGTYIDTYKPTQSLDELNGISKKPHTIRQSATSWTEKDPVQMNKVEYKYGEFLDDTTLFELEAGVVTKIDMYLWLEGQDYDCTNLIGEEAEILSSIQFFATEKGQSGMDEIR